MRLARAAIAPARTFDVVASPSSSPTLLGGELKNLTVHRICLFGFDELKGNTLLASSKVSKRFQVASHSDAELAEICLPDGGHTREHDAVATVLKTTDEMLIYGYSCFRNVPNASEKRGARQASILILSDSPGMDLFRPFLVDALDHLLCSSNWGNAAYLNKALNALKLALDKGFNRQASQMRLFASEETLKEESLSIEMWQRTYKIRRVSFLPGEFGGGLLKELVKVFRERTIRIWYALAAEKRVMFVGSNLSASCASTCVLAAPLLIGDLGPFVTSSLEPYVTLAVVDRITNRRTFIAGANNALFLQKSEWWDMCCDLNTGAIHEEFHAPIVSCDESFHNESAAPSSSTISKLRVLRRRTTSSHKVPVPGGCLVSPVMYPKVSGGVEMAFISRVLHDIDLQSEAWLRRQFHDFTLSFLNRVGRKGAQADLSTALAGLFHTPNAILQSRLSKFAENFAQTGLWRQYRTNQDEIWGGSVLYASPGKDAVGSPGTKSANGMASPVTSPGFQEDETGFMSTRGRTLAPFLLEAANRTLRAPTGFIRVEDVCKRTSGNFNRRSRGFEEEKSFNKGSPSKSIVPGRWVQVNHENGEPYYWNVSSGETTWEIPDDLLL